MASKLLQANTPYIASFILVQNLLLVTPQPMAAALYVFGDSLFDSGNNFPPTAAMADYLPYGQNFAGGVTGRFTNGRTVADFIAEYLGLPYSPPYISFPKLNWLTGFNYASGSCGILPETGLLLGARLSLDAQINLFQMTVNLQLPLNFQGSNDLSNYLSKSISIITIGSNDYIINYLLQPDISDTNQQYTPQKFAQHLINSLSQKLQKLYSLGARKIVVFELGPIGCIPDIAGMLAHQGQCDENMNSMISMFNTGLAAMLNSLTSTLPGSFFILGHESKFAYDAAMNPSRYDLYEALQTRL